MRRPCPLEVIQLLSREVELELTPAVLVCPLEVLDGLHDRVLHHWIGTVADEGRDESWEVLGQVVGEQEDHAG